MQCLESSKNDARLDLIRALIPLGLSFVMEELDREVVSLAGTKHSRKAGEGVPRRHGSNPGSVKLAGQSIPIRMPRLRADGNEVALASYEDLHKGGDLNDQVFRQMLYGVSCRNYEQAAEQIPGAIGLSSSTISRNSTHEQSFAVLGWKPPPAIARSNIGTQSPNGRAPSIGRIRKSTSGYWPIAELVCSFDVSTASS